jgi:hypothetical protein
MMGWEGPLMVKHAEVICAGGGDILNVGFGLGLIDNEVQVSVWGVWGGGGGGQGERVGGEAARACL